MGRRYRSHNYSSYGKSKGSGSPNTLLLSLLMLIVLGSFSCIITFAALSGRPTISPRKPKLSPQEQYLHCTNKNINLKYTSNNINVYESVNGTPKLSTEIRERTQSMTGKNRRSHKYLSFFLAPGSNLTWNFYAESPYVDVILIKGVKQMNKFLSKQGSYTSEYWDNYETYTYNVSDYDEYFIIVYAYRHGFYSIDVTASMTVYDTSDLTEQCNFYPGSGKCTLNSDKNDEFCVLIDYPSDEENNTVSDSSTAKIVISGKGAPDESVNTYIILVGVFCGVFVVSLILFILVIYMAVKKSSDGTSNDNNSTNDSTAIAKDDQDFSQQKNEVEMGYTSQPAISPSYIPTSIPTAYQAAPNNSAIYVDTSYPTAPPPQ